ncbi:poly(A)-specific ribonuclease PARN [Canna indica]|uniref:Poly(A)-specific ribonuclease PARN n=1 Tax=Canna indica TaxID=4628 RepID=A0AAQ3KNW8_9LILI|nr:poly(A)-specific ribonuclease PARN [Canna indica]
MTNLTLVWARSQALTLRLLPSLPRFRHFSAAADSDGGGVAVKKVTRSNFEAALEDLRTRVRESDFVAVDIEMTGVTSAPWRDSFEFDRSDVRYLKLKDSAEKFAVVQFGVCPFRWEASQSSFVAHPHNFYVFPRKELPVHGPSSEFLCQTTSIDFLAKYQFDFNACIHEGISYLSREQEAEAFKFLSSEYLDGLANSFCNLEEHVDIPLVRTSDLLFSERMKIRFQEWRTAILRSSSKCCTYEGGADDNDTQFQTVFFKMRPAIKLNGFSSNQLKLIQLVLRKHFKDLVYIRVADENFSWQRRVVYVDSEEDKALLKKEVQEDLIRNADEKVRSAVGFRHVVDLLASEGKLIVGHNCLLDLAHIYCKFFGPLPSSMDKFVSALHEKFPHIIDTKHLLNSSQAIQYLMKNNSKSLSSAFYRLCHNVSSVSQNFTSNTYLRFEVQADESGSSCFKSGASHEAGYDAFMTGCVFAQACSHMGIKFDMHTASCDLIRNEKIKKYINILYPSWNSRTVIHLDTGIENPDSSYRHKYPVIIFSNIVLIWGFPSKFKPKDLKELICKVFGRDSVISVFYIDRTSALIQFSKKELVNDFLVSKDSLERNNDPVSVLHPLTKLLEGGNTCAADYDTYRDICATSASKILFAEQADSLGISWKTKVGTGSQDIQDASCNEKTTADNSLIKHASGMNKVLKSQSKHQPSCGDILDSLYVSKSLLGKAMRST